MKRLLYSKDELAKSYETLVKRASFYYKIGCYRRTRGIIKRAAKLQYNLNIIYSDSRLNNLLKGLSSKRFGKIDDFQGINNTVIFYDSLTVDNGGLSQQYLDALINNHSIKTVYVSEQPISKRGEHILKTLEREKVQYYELNKNCIKAEEELKGIIELHKPHKLFLHILPHSTLPFIVGYAFPTLLKYQVNLTDHAFWLGGPDFFDKIIEFRNYGAQVSLEKRGFSLDQIVLLPFYPWQEKTKFEGFPEIKQSVIVFSGGATYKISGGGNTFFSVVDNLLEEHKEVVFLFAGSGNTEYIEEFKRRSNNSDRIHYLGFRRDIAEVMKHIDIYLNTYPLSGGLMLQLAAINRKPILALNDGQCESLVCTKKKAKFSFDVVGDLMNEANKLVTDLNYRSERAEFFHSLVVTREDFIIDFYNKCILEKKYEESLEVIDIDYDGFCDIYIKSINSGQLELFVEQNILRASPFALNWKMFFNCVVYGFSFLKKNLKK